jgi:hypothetical protein
MYQIRNESTIVLCGSGPASFADAARNDCTRMLQIRAFIRTYPDLTRFPDSRF